VAGAGDEFGVRVVHVVEFLRVRILHKLYELILVRITPYHTLFEQKIVPLQLRATAPNGVGRLDVLARPAKLRYYHRLVVQGRLDSAHPDPFRVRKADIAVAPVVELLKDVLILYQAVQNDDVRQVHFDAAVAGGLENQLGRVAKPAPVKRVDKVSDILALVDNVANMVKRVLGRVDTEIHVRHHLLVYWRDVLVDDKKIARIEKLSRENVQTELALNGDPVEHAKQFAVIVVDRLGLADCHARDRFRPSFEVADELEIVLNGQGVHEHVLIGRDAVAARDIVVRPQQCGVLARDLANPRQQ